MVKYWPQADCKKLSTVIVISRETTLKKNPKNKTIQRIIAKYTTEKLKENTKKKLKVKVKKKKSNNPKEDRDGE